MGTSGNRIAIVPADRPEELALPILTTLSYGNSFRDAIVISLDRIVLLEGMVLTISLTYLVLG